jgi:hypothetical protein
MKMVRCQLRPICSACRPTTRNDGKQARTSDLRHIKETESYYGIACPKVSGSKAPDMSAFVALAKAKDADTLTGILADIERLRISTMNDLLKLYSHDTFPSKFLRRVLQNQNYLDNAIVYFSEYFVQLDSSLRRQLSHSPDICTGLTDGPASSYPSGPLSPQEADTIAESDDEPLFCEDMVEADVNYPVDSDLESQSEQEEQGLEDPQEISLEDTATDCQYELPELIQKYDFNSTNNDQEIASRTAAESTTQELLIQLALQYQTSREACRTILKSIRKIVSQSCEQFKIQLHHPLANVDYNIGRFVRKCKPAVRTLEAIVCPSVDCKLLHLQRQLLNCCRCNTALSTEGTPLECAAYANISDLIALQLRKPEVLEAIKRDNDKRTSIQRKIS